MIPVDNAILMAAGAASRMAPLSYECPKALLRVHGEILIERQIRQLQECGIKEIIVVLGYQKEKFQYLQDKYNVILLENNEYNIKNNHSTLYVARQYLKNSYICTVDMYYTMNLFQSHEPHAYYSVKYDEGETDEWCVETDKNDRIINVQIGGRDSWTMTGHVFFTREFSNKLIPYLEQAYHDPNAANMYWEDLYIQHLDEFDMYAKKYKNGLMLEFDSLEDLRQYDPTYKTNSGSKILQTICQKLHCLEEDIINIKPIKQDAEAIGFQFHCHQEQYYYLYKTEELVQELESLLAS
ncbi:MAG TPA: NTP transferase domain-containing protein [Planctomycetota bacterium]|nr:NTP transferase domain-containing protein [Planctomycetota bacterium]HQB00809.1 NTP transferase domain-containing protein [Planctomycetota bacterium]